MWFAEVIIDQKTVDAYEELRNTARNYIEHSAYNSISFGPLATLFSTKQEPENTIVSQIAAMDPFTLDLEDL